ncbi:hypothetical protein [Sporolactobacillus sp. KGMB 08714]|uniref:hypothetical protein n=1 Tax=Sporolactobacillus sp. KGMB 08714 TaxID=3064704 RepID=UPI002FBD9373
MTSPRSIDPEQPSANQNAGTDEALIRSDRERLQSLLVLSFCLGEQCSGIRLKDFVKLLIILFYLYAFAGIENAGESDRPGPDC